MSPRLVPVVALGAALLTGAAPSSAHTPAAGPPSGLTRSGRDLWQFEALLRDEFGAKVVSTHALNFACAGADCTPAAYWSPYIRTFTAARHSSFHLSGRSFGPGAFGNYPTVVRVNGRTVACDMAEHRFLVAHVDAAVPTLDCLRLS